MFQAKSIIEIPHPTTPLVWPIGILQDLLAPYGVPNLQLGRKEQRATKPLDGECLAVD